MIITIPENPLQPLQEFGPVIDSLIKKIKTKECKDLGTPFIAYHLHHYLRIHTKEAQRLQQPKPETSAAFSQVVKYIRMQARPIFGVFEQKNREKQTSTFLEDPSEKNRQALLATHKSTQERVPYYDEFCMWIQSVLPQKANVLDIAAGLNPVVLLNSIKGIKRYDTIEVSESTAALYKAICEKYKCEHTHIITHLPAHYESLPQQKYDLVLALKTFDTLEQQKRHMTIKLLTQLQTDKLLCSFSMQTIKGTPMKREHAGWFIRVVRQLGIEIIDERAFGDELCYLVDFRAAR